MNDRCDHVYLTMEGVKPVLEHDGTKGEVFKKRDSFINSKIPINLNFVLVSPRLRIRSR